MRLHPQLMLCLEIGALRTKFAAEAVSAFNFRLSRAHPEIERICNCASRRRSRSQLSS